jgi:hypothetical protein
MLPRRLTLPVLIAATALLLVGCADPEPAMQPFNDCSLPEDQADEQCMDELAPLQDFQATYELSGVIDGKDFSGFICALNLMPTYRASDADGWGFLDFYGDDKTATSGVVRGSWRWGNDNEIFQIDENGGRFVRQGATGADPGTLVLTLDGQQMSDGQGSSPRSVEGVLELTPVETPDENDEPCGFPWIDLESLQDSYDTYAGPPGAGI